MRNNRGFTLIELMIVVVVVAILAAVAYPNYIEQVRKSRREQAKALMVEYTHLAERFHTVNNSYVGFALPSAQSPENGTSRYGLQATTQTATAFVITATPQGSQTKDPCGTMTVSNTGQKGSGGTLAECW
ncbi:type IV pilin protein [Pseudoxanthomonas mexicana]|uniref:type IV pilin protein n=1 Tax=Pseudoxanthomonas mexicana TaxID=128785 RepID=UPI00398B500A